VTTDEAATPEARAFALLSEEFAPGPRRVTGLTGLVRKLVDRATLAARHHQYHVDSALLQAIQDLEHRRALDAAEIRRLDDTFAPRLADVETRAAVAASLATEISQQMSGVSEELERVAKQLAREIADIREEAKKAQFLFDEATSRPYLSDPSSLYTVDDEGLESLAFRDAPGPQPIYAGFEDLFRGSMEMIRERQRPYLELLRDHAPVIDVGCGRGELLDLLKAEGLEASGIDLDPDMVETCRARGLDVELGDGLELLEKQADASVGAVFSAQVVEHLGTDDVVRLLRVALGKLRPGGLFVAETVNPHSPRALKAFWVDPTHVRPIFPETLLALARLTGYRSGSVYFPLGSGSLDQDLRTQGEYAVVAVAPD
jgi:SAM-dependent methyltransferase